MSASIYDRQSALSASVSYDTISKNTNSKKESGNSQNSSNNSNESETNSANEFSDSFEFSSVKYFSDLTYSSDIFKNTQTTNSNDEKETVTIPKSFEELKNEANQVLDDYFGTDNDQRSEFKTTLNNLESIDPELAQKALFLITLLGKDDAEKLLSDISEFTSKIRNTQTQTTNLSVNVVASAESTTLDKVYTSMMNETNIAIEKYEEIISEKFNIEVNVDMSSMFSGNLQMGLVDPLVFDIDGDGIDLTSTEDGVEFDIDGDGVVEKTAFIKDDDALLYLDQNGNGTADSGKELFGDQEGDANGYAELSKYDENNDGKIDNLDKVYAELRLWQDKNQDGKNQKTESMTLLEAGIKSIQLKYDQVMKDDDKGNKIAQTGKFTRTDGSTGYSADMLLRAQIKPNNISALILS